MPVMDKAESGHRQELGAPPGSLMWVARIQSHELSPLAVCYAIDNRKLAMGDPKLENCHFNNDIVAAYLTSKCFKKKVRGVFKEFM